MIHQIREHDINIPSESSSSSIALTKKTPNRVSKQPIIARHRNARFWDCTAQERPINAKDTAVTAPKQKGKTFIIESTVQRWSPRLTVSILSLGPWQLQLYDTYDIFHVCPLFSPHPWFSSNSWRYLNPPTSRLEAQRVIFLATWFILLTKSP